MNLESKTIKVTCAIIERSGRILIAQRNENMNMALKWEFPGGKLEANETPEDCIVREIKEELGIDIKIKQGLKPNTHKYEANAIELIPYVCEIVSGELIINEHKRIMWKYPEELKDIDWAEADIPIYNQYLACIKGAQKV